MDKKQRIKKSHPVLRVIGGFFVILFTLLVIAVGSLFVICATIAKGPSTTMRDKLVLAAMQASATKWVPGLFLSDETVQEIVDASHAVVSDATPIDRYETQTAGKIVTEESESPINWDKAVDGLLYFTAENTTFKYYVMIVKDPSRVFTGIAALGSGEGLRIFDIVEKYSTPTSKIVAAINAGEYDDDGITCHSDRPIGITYSEGRMVWYDGAVHQTFIGFDRNNKLVVQEGMTKEEAAARGIRDGVCFQKGNTLINNDGENVYTYYAPQNTGPAQRTAIGQLSDGSVILIVTDGRSSQSLGATHDDMINVMASYGAVTAGLLDGGSSSLMYYRNYWDILGIDRQSLDTYQRMGIVNRYKAFTYPRLMPTYFLVRPEQ